MLAFHAKLVGRLIDGRRRGLGILRGESGVLVVRLKLVVRMLREIMFA